MVLKLDNFREKSLFFILLFKFFFFKLVGNDVIRRLIRIYLRLCDVCIILLFLGYLVKWYLGINGFYFMLYFFVMYYFLILFCYDCYYFLLGNKLN